MVLGSKQKGAHLGAQANRISGCGLTMWDRGVLDTVRGSAPAGSDPVAKRLTGGSGGSLRRCACGGVGTGTTADGNDVDLPAPRPAARCKAPHEKRRSGDTAKVDAPRHTCGQIRGCRQRAAVSQSEAHSWSRSSHVV